jgi:hypothetical protein
MFFANCFEAKGHPDLGRIVRKGRLVHRFRFCCGYDLADREGFPGLFAGLLGALGRSSDFHWEKWKAEALKRYENGRQLQQVIEIYDKNILIWPAGGSVVSIENLRM